MILTSEEAAQEQVQKLPYARQVLEDILAARIPSEDTLSHLYSRRKIPGIIQELEDFYNSGYTPGTIRKHNPSAPQDLAQAREQIESDDDFSTTHRQVRHFREVDRKIMEKYFGEFTQAVLKMDQLFYKLARDTAGDKGMRDCLLPSPAHHHRVAIMGYQLGMDPDGDKSNIATLRFHDAIEDPLPLTLGIERYEEYKQLYIPKKLQEPVERLTNGYDLVFNYAQKKLKDNNRVVNRENLKGFLEGMMEDRKFAPVSPYVRKILNIMADRHYENDLDSPRFFNNLKFICYNGLYIPEMAMLGTMFRDDLTIRNKGLDMYDNGDALEDVLGIDKVKTILKTQVFVNETYGMQLHSTPLNHMTMELAEKALNNATDMILNPMLKKSTQADKMHSLLIKFKMLQAVFFTDKPIPNNFAELSNIQW